MQRSRTGLEMWLRWFIASTAGIVLGLMMSNGIATVELENYTLLRTALAGAAFGVCLTAVQMISIAQYLKMGRWIVSGLLGYSLGFTLTQVVSNWLQLDVWLAAEGRSFAFIAVAAGAVGLAVGLPVGSIQWWSFRQGRVAWIGWVLASILAIGVSVFVTLLVAWKVNTDQTVNGLEIPAIFLPAAGIFSMFSWLPVYQSRESNTSKSTETAATNLNLEDHHSTPE